MSNIHRFVDSLTESGHQFSDIIFKDDKYACVRRPDGWEVTDFKPQRGDFGSLLSQIDPHWKVNLTDGRTVDRTVMLDRVRVRVSLFYANNKETTVLIMRQLPAVPPTMDDIGLPLLATNFARSQSGLLLVSGATGCGKTTTISAVVNDINHRESKHIITLEQPIEYLHFNQQSIITQREVGSDTVSFSEGLREAMRHRPDVIVVGEIRDRDTAEACLRAAESGHFVLATTHAKSAVGSLQKLLSLFGEEATSKAVSLSHCLVGAIYQDLLPSKDGKCFVLASEIISGNDPTMGKLLSEHMSYHQIEESLGAGRLKGGISLNSSLKHLVETGKIDKQVAYAASSNTTALRQMLVDTAAKP